MASNFAVGRDEDGPSTTDEEKLEMIKRKPIVFVLGGPGSGKGTQCRKISKDFNFLHLCAGDLLRHEVARGTEQGKRINDIMIRGELVPADDMVSLLKAEMLCHAESAGFLIDGFPRELENGDRLFKEKVCRCTAVLSLECTDKVMTERLLERGKTSGRDDDNLETIHKRLLTFHNQTQPVIAHYQQQDRLRKVDATKSEDEVYEDVRKTLKELLRR